PGLSPALAERPTSHRGTGPGLSPALAERPTSHRGTGPGLSPVLTEHPTRLLVVICRDPSHTRKGAAGMAEGNGGPYGRKTQRAPAVKEVHILWITAGLSCDGDSVSTTAASQPSIEDIVMGAIPGLPKVHLHNPVLAYEVGDEFMNYWYQA